MSSNQQEDERDLVAVQKDAEALQYPDDMGSPVAVYKSLDYYQVQLIRSALQSAGIPVWVSGEWLRSGQGEIPFLESAPEIFVPADHFDQAVQVINELEAIDENPDTHPPWRCEHCGEEVDGVFAECWNCGRPAPAE